MKKCPQHLKKYLRYVEDESGVSVFHFDCFCNGEMESNTIRTELANLGYIEHTYPGLRITNKGKAALAPKTH